MSFFLCDAPPPHTPQREAAPVLVVFGLCALAALALVVWQVWLHRKAAE